MLPALATSVGSRSMLDAPRSPPTPHAWSITCWASSGSALGPPW